MWLLCFFFFKQKTAYEMRISDWSSDVCSSDLHNLYLHGSGPGHASPRTMRRGGPSGLVLRAHRDHGLAVRIQRDRDHDRPAADLAVLDVLLVTGGAVAEQVDRTAAVRASGVECGHPTGPPRSGGGGGRQGCVGKGIAW